MNICIVGGGALGHVCAGVLASQSDVNVNIYTQQPQLWSHDITINDINKKCYKGHINLISNEAKKVIANSDIVFLCLPGFLIQKTLNDIKPHISKNTVIGSIVCSTGFFFIAHNILDKQCKLFGFQRTPFIARVNEYGKSANILGYKSEVAIACENIDDQEIFRKHIEALFITPTILLNNFYEASLTNSNPILHTGRLYSMWSNWSGEVYDHNILFYKEWTDDASRTIINMDNEFINILSKLPIDKKNIPSILDYYESFDASSLTNKISSIPAFQNITSPMKCLDDGRWIPDFNSRYFTEDFPFGLRYIKELAEMYNIDTPTINKVYTWGINMINKNDNNFRK